MLILFSALYLILAVFSAGVIIKQQHTIERLTDRLMARDYKEYQSFKEQPKIEETPKRDPQSWYDDPDIKE